MLLTECKEFWSLRECMAAPVAVMCVIVVVAVVVVVGPCSVVWGFRSFHFLYSNPKHIALKLRLS